MMTLLFLGVVGLLVWVVTLQDRVATLESRDAELRNELVALRARLETPAAPSSPPHTPRQTAAERTAAVSTPTPAGPTAPHPRVAPPRVAPPPVAPPVARPVTPPAPPAPPVRPPVEPVVGASERVGKPSRPPSAAPPTPSRPFDWEELIGVRLFSWVAGIALAVAAVFFLGYSIQQGWLQPPVRVAIGLLVGVGLLVACELKAARRYPVTANAMDGAAIVILFSTFFAAYRLWELIGPLTAFALLGLLTVVAVLLSIRRDSVFIALLGLVGGFSTPALLSTGQDNPFGLFGYLLLLNAGLGWVAYRKKWPALSVLSLLLTTVYQWGWVGSFMTPAKAAIGAGIFLVFPVLGFASLGLAGRAGALDTGADRSRSSWFEEAAAVNGALPLLFAVFMAGSPAYGEHPGLVFGFLLCVDAGLLAVALWRRQMLLHLLGAIATLVVFATWMSTAYVPTGEEAGASYPMVLALVGVFAVFYLAAGLTARRGSRRLEGAGRLGVYAAPLLLFAFPALARIEPAVAGPAMPFAVLFGLLAACAVYAVTEGDAVVYFIAAFLAVAAQAAWSATFLTPERLVEALVVYAAFGLLMIGVPLAARRAGRPLEPAAVGGVLVLASIALLLFLSQGSMAASSLWGLAVLLTVLNVALFIEGREAALRQVAIAGAVLSWLVLGSWWLTGYAASHLVAALVVTAGFSLLMLAGQLWMRAPAERSSDESQAALALGLVGHLFLAFVAVQPSLSIPPWPMLAALAVLDVAVGVAALATRRGETHAAAVGLSQLILLTWVQTADYGPWPTVALLAAAAVGAFAIGWSLLSLRRVGDAQARKRFHAAAIIGLAFGEAVAIASSVSVSLRPPVAALFHSLFLGGLLVVGTFAGWLEVSLLAAALAAAATWAWQFVPPKDWTAALSVSTPIYLLFVVYPAAIGRRVGKSIGPHLAAVLASASFFFAARLSLEAGGFGSVIGLLPVAEAAVVGALLALLLRLERPSERALGRLALVAAAALAFVTVAIPLQLDKEWVTIGWALEGAALAWLFGRIPHRGLFWWSVALLGTVFVRLSLNPEVLVYHARSSVPILNWYLYTYLACAGAMLAAGWCYARSDDRLVESMRASSVLPAAATALLFLLLNIEIADFFATGDTIAFHLSAGLAQNLTYTLAWAGFAVALLVAGIALGSHAARLSAIVLLTVTVLKGFLSDVARLGGLYRVMSFVGLAVSLSLVAVVLQRFVLAPKTRAEQERQGR